MIDISRIDSQTLQLMKEISKSDKEYCIPLIDTHGSISAYDIIEGSESSVCAITPSLIPWMVAQFHNHPGEIKVLISDEDMIISYKFNIPLIIGGKKEIKLFELKPNNTLKNDLEQLTRIRSKVLENLSLGKTIDKELGNKFKNTYEKTLSNFNITFVYIEK